LNGSRGGSCRSAAELDLLVPGTFFASSELAYLAVTRMTVMHAN